MSIALNNLGSFSNDPLEHHHRPNGCVRWLYRDSGTRGRYFLLNRVAWVPPPILAPTKWLCEMILLGHWNEGEIFPTHQWLEFHHRSLHRPNGCVIWFSRDSGTRRKYFLLTSLSTTTDPGCVRWITPTLG